MKNNFWDSNGFKQPVDSQLHYGETPERGRDTEQAEGGSLDHHGKLGVWRLVHCGLVTLMLNEWYGTGYIENDLKELT